MKLSVPYYSQFVDIEDPFWMVRACGSVCMKSLAESQGITMPTLLELCNEAKSRDGYHMQNGWVHDYIVTRLNEAGLHAHREEGLQDVTKILESLKNGKPVIVSVEKRVLEQKRFHMITIVGYEEGPQSNEFPITYHLSPITSFYYHESESTDKEKGQYRSCDIKTFMEYWRGKAIFLD